MFCLSKDVLLTVTIFKTFRYVRSVVERLNWHEDYSEVKFSWLPNYLKAIIVTSESNPENTLISEN